MLGLPRREVRRGRAETKVGDRAYRRASLTAIGEAERLPRLVAIEGLSVTVWTPWLTGGVGNILRAFARRTALCLTREFPQNWQLFFMGRGRKPGDPKVVELTGPVSHRPEPEPPVGEPGALTPNSEFDDDALVAWEFWTGHMATAGMSYPIDSIALQAACFAYSRAMRAERLLRTEPQNWRADVSATRNWKQVQLFCVEFGLTLVSRNKVVRANPQMRLDLEMESALSAERVN